MTYVSWNINDRLLQKNYRNKFTGRRVKNYFLGQTNILKTRTYGPRDNVFVFILKKKKEYFRNIREQEQVLSRSDRYGDPI